MAFCAEDEVHGVVDDELASSGPRSASYRGHQRAKNARQDLGAGAPGFAGYGGAELYPVLRWHLAPASEKQVLRDAQDDKF